ncbi:MAG: hypothetical protein EZS28_010110 [Streblomastix strix]|uniref:SPRY domain-containing protein n=1 Tax=Streblomastix strix TaxID=222440 RepID=A0A5J4WH15_9EUKA|nr:MAG: hypothetical protein EZS28_010110 [Streblomastix strix]
MLKETEQSQNAKSIKQSLFTQEQYESEKADISVPQEYNVIDGFIGLGSYIHLEMMNKMDDLPDVQQFIGVNKRIFQLKDHPRFNDVIENALIDKKSEIENPDPTGQDVKLEHFNGLLRKAVVLIKEDISISLNKVIKNGIHSISVIFDKCGYLSGYIGICKADYKIPYPCKPWDKPHCQNMLYYWGFDGKICFKGNATGGNAEFYHSQLLTMELNMDAGTLHFFVDGVQQPVFVHGINEPVKFYFELFFNESSFTVTSVKQLIAVTAKAHPKSKAFEW